MLNCIENVLRVNEGFAKQHTPNPFKEGRL